MLIQTPDPALRINGVLSKGNIPNKIILHHPVFNGTPQELNEMEISNTNDPMKMSAYNFYVRKNGSIYAMRPVWAEGANCYGQNLQSIGVCAEGNFMIDTMTKVQEDAIISLCQYLKKAYPGIKEIGPHYKYYNTACPGKNYPVAAVISGSNTILEVIDNMTVKEFQEFYNSFDLIFGAKLVTDGADGPLTEAARLKLKAIFTYVLK